ncbi:TonB-dependent receptor [Sphingomonas sp. 4RDLI-65]|uniref:TonB-dependent receptor n=1 Tax=Sphingomonas sp. 4RDLI-65 TaxID=3111641 RepID=UPI003C2B5637
MTLRRCMTSTLALILAGGGTAGMAQVAAPPGTTPDADAKVAADASLAQVDEGADSGEILVTARKRAEDILKTPVAISAFTSADLTARGVVSINDVASFTPGMKISNASSSGARSDRSFQQVIIRGFTPSTALSQTTSIFIDGVPVSSATAIETITDPERVEILKGPQSAYFGRQTFAGALNIVTKLPTERLTGSVDGLLGTRNNYDVQGELSGPIFGDVLGFRLSGRKLSKDGSYDNAGVNGQTLGDQSTKSGTLSLVFKPASNFTAKAFGLLSLNNDGPGATGLISAYTIRNAAGQVIVPGQSNCTLNGLTSTGVARTNAFLCGTTPSLASTAPSANTINDSFTKNFLANPRGRLIDPDDGVQGYGLRSRTVHLHLAMDWDIPGSDVTLSSLTGVNREQYSELSDLKNYYDTTATNPFGGTGSRAYFDFPFLIERKSKDFSQEVRASFDNQGPVHATIGASYLNAYSVGGSAGGNTALGVTTFSSVGGGARSRTFGGFFGVGWEIIPGFSINADGRYQIDNLYAYAPLLGVTLTSSTFAPAGAYGPNAQLLKGTYKNFLPRLIAQFDFDPSTMMYASFSKGVNPGAFNSTFLTATPATQRAADAAGFSIMVEPEKLDNYEIGLKGKAFGNVLRYSISAYHAIWKNQINSQTLVLVDPENNLPQLVQGSANTGKVRMQGIEVEATANITPELAFNASGALNDSYILALVAPQTTQLTGLTNYRGKENPNTSKYSAAIGGSYTAPLPGLTDVDGYVRADFTYKSGVYSNAANILKTPDMTQVNLRIGARSAAFTVEAFVTNLFNNQAYNMAVDNYVFNNTFTYTSYNSAVLVSLRELRTVGIRTKFSF